jgi:DNA-binding IclR family transcriptional regulator
VIASPDTIPPGTQTLARGLAVIRAVGDGAHGLREIVERTGLGRSSTHRLAQLLVAQGFLRHDNRGYTLGPALIELGFKALHGNPLPLVARPVLEELSATVLDTVHLAVEDGGSVLYLDKLPGSRGAEMRSRIGYRMPLTRAGVGKALLLDAADRWAEQYAADEARLPAGAKPGDLEDFLTRMQTYARTGAAMDLEDNEPGIRCVAAPIRDATWRPDPPGAHGEASGQDRCPAFPATGPVHTDRKATAARRAGASPERTIAGTSEGGQPRSADHSATTETQEPQNNT